LDSEAITLSLTRPWGVETAKVMGVRSSAARSASFTGAALSISDCSFFASVADKEVVQTHFCGLAVRPGLAGRQHDDVNDGSVLTESFGQASLSSADVRFSVWSESKMM